MLIDSWILEYLGWLFAAAALALIIILLGVFNEKPLSTFQSNLTLNTLISAIGQIGKTALLVPVASSISQYKWIWYQKYSSSMKGMEDFDEASRDIFDSLLLVFKRPKL